MLRRSTVSLAPGRKPGEAGVNVCECTTKWCRVYPAPQKLRSADKVFPAVFQGSPAIGEVFPARDKLFPALDEVYPTAVNVYSVRKKGAGIASDACSGNWKLATGDRRPETRNR